MCICDVESTNQTVIINESISSDEFAAAQLRQQAAAPASSQPVITATRSAPDVFYNEPRPPSIISDSQQGCVRFEDDGAILPVASRQDVQPQAEVPAYRPAPDYNTVMQQRMLSQYYPSYVHPYLNPDCTSFSQPDIYQHSAVVVPYGRAPPSGTHAVDRASSLVIHPESTGVARHASVASAFVPRTNQYLYYRAPPPYPRQSSSTPDLASPTKLGALLMHAGPDFQLQRVLHGNAQFQFDESLENLAAEVQQVHVYGSQSGYNLSGPVSYTHLTLPTKRIV